MRFAQRVARRDVTRELVESNTTNALKMRGNWNAADRLTERRAVIRLMARSLQESGSKACVVKAWANNTVTARTVEGGS